MQKTYTSVFIDKADPIPPKTAEKLLDWMSIDLQLYTWANETLWKEIAKEKDFAEELSYYKSINNLVGAFCKANVFLLRVSMYLVKEMICYCGA